MNILIDNKDLLGVFGINVLDYTPVLHSAPERENERVWADKSGVDKNLSIKKWDAFEFILPCYCKAENEYQAFLKVQNLSAYLMSKGVVVLSLRDTVRSIRTAILCARSGAITGNISIRNQNSLYYFKLGLKNMNPNAVHYSTEIVDNEVVINYEKGQTAMLYWGEGSQQLVTNSGNYTKSDFADNGPVDVIIDIDKNALQVAPLIADFDASVVSGSRPLSVSFTDTSEGSVEIWSWNFGDGQTSAEQNPVHIYQNTGIYTVTLQVFNSAKGYATKIQTNYISVRNARLLINATDSFLINSTDNLLIN